MEITDYNYIASAIGNAKYSSLTLEEIWSCFLLAENPQQFDEAVSDTIKLKLREISIGKV